MHIEASLSLTRRPGSGLISPPSAVQRAQRRLVAVTAQLQALDHELHEICESLPLPHDQGAMEDELVMMDVALWLHTTLVTVKRQALRPVIDQLRKASQRTEEDQRLAFYEVTS